MATKTWASAVSGATWNTAGNWSPSGVPVAGDDTVFGTSPSSTQVSNPNVNTAIASITATPTSTNRWYLGSGTASRASGTWTPPWPAGADVTVTSLGTQYYSDLVLYFAQISGSGQIRKKGNGTLYIPYTADSTESNINTGWSGGIDVQAGGIGTALFPSGSNTNTCFGTGTLIFAAGTNLYNGATGFGLRISNPIIVNGNWETLNRINIAGLDMVLAGTAEFNNSPTITITSTGSASTSGSVNILGVVSGTGGFIKAGNRNLTLSNASGNTISGTVRVDASSLIASTALALQNVTFNPSGAGTLSLPATATLGGLTGSGSFNGAGATTLTLGGGTMDVSASTTANLSGTFNISKVRAGTQQFGGTSTRSAGSTTISAGAIQSNSANALYANANSGTSSVALNAGLWVSGGVTHQFGTLTINGTGVSLDGAIRNISGSNTVASSITLGASSTIKNDVASTTLTLKAISIGANNLTLSTSTGGTIQLDNAPTSSAGSQLLVTGTGTVKANAASVLAATTNQIDGTFDLNGTTQTIASGKTLDGTASMNNSGSVVMAAGSTLKAGSGAGNQTLSIGALILNAITMTLPKGATATLSKVAVTDAVTHSGTVTVNASASSWVSGSQHTFLTYGSKTGTGTFAAGTLTGATVRQSMSIDTPGLTSATFTVAGNGNTSVTWNGGDAGNWYNDQATGWSGTGVTDFKNGDTVTFDATSSTTATLTGNVNVASLTMNGAAHTIGGAFTLTNAGSLALSGAFRQILNVAGEHGAVSINGAGTTLELGNVNALGSGATAITLTSTNARLAFNSGANGLSTIRPLTFTPGGSVSQYLETSGDASVTITGTITNSTSGASIVKVGSGLVSLTGTNNATAIFRIGDQNVTETPGRNVLRLSNVPGATASAMRLNGGSILELTQNFTKAYGSAANQIYLESGTGAGFSAYNSSGINVSTPILFAASTRTTYWDGTLYFGTALGTATGKVTMTSTLALVTGYSSQTFYVFNGATAGAASSARINLLNNNNNTGTQTFIKDGPGALYVVTGTTAGGSSTMRVSAGAFEVGPTTTNIINAIEIPSGASSAVVRQESSVSSTTAPGFSPTPAADFTVEAAGTGTFTLGTLDIGTRTVTLAGTGTGAKATTSGTGSGKYVKTGTGTWSLDFAYASKAAGFSGGAEVQEGTLKTTKKFGLGGGPIAITAGAKVQFTDTSTDPTIIGSIASLTTTGSTARIIIGA